MKAGLSDRLREAIPPGFSFGGAVEILIENWLAVTPEERIRGLLSVSPQALDERIKQIINRIIDEALASGRLTRPPARANGNGHPRSNHAGSHPHKKEHRE